MWKILECRGCQNVTFVHTHWFSEDEEWGDDGPELIVHRDLYPPAPPRAKPEWASELWHRLAHKDRWVDKLHGDIYGDSTLRAAIVTALDDRAAALRFSVPTPLRATNLKRLKDAIVAPPNSSPAPLHRSLPYYGSGFLGGRCRTKQHGGICSERGPNNCKNSGDDHPLKSSAVTNPAGE